MLKLTPCLMQPHVTGGARRVPTLDSYTSLNLTSDLHLSHEDEAILVMLVNTVTYLQFFSSCSSPAPAQLQPLIKSSPSMSISAAIFPSSAPSYPLVIEDMDQGPSKTKSLV